MRDAVYGILNHCEQQRNGRYDQRQPMAQTGQVSDELAQSILSPGFTLLEAALTQNGVNHPQGNQVDNTTDVLSAATSAYQQGHITKAQYFAVINALDETTAATDPNAENQIDSSIIARFAKQIIFPPDEYRLGHGRSN